MRVVFSLINLKFRFEGRNKLFDLLLSCPDGQFFFDTVFDLLFCEPEMPFST